MLAHGIFIPKEVKTSFAPLCHKKTSWYSPGGLYGVEDRVRTGDLWNHNPAL